MADIPDTNLSQLGPVEYGSFTVEVIDPVSDYMELMEVSTWKLLFFYLFPEDIVTLIFFFFLQLCY